MTQRDPDPPPIPIEPAGDAEFVLSWKYPDGTVARGRPLPRSTAEQLARIFGSMYPEEAYWLEPAPKDARAEGRVIGKPSPRRRRAVEPGA
jgi:hypothetical protein